MEISFPYFGETLSFLVAIVWALAVVLFKRSGETVHPLSLNLFKNVLAIILFVPTIWIFGEALFRNAPVRDYALLVISGVLGIGIGDTLFFYSLNYIGAGFSAIVSCMYSPFLISLSLIWLRERLTTWQIIGAAIIIGAVLMTMQVRRRASIRKGRFLFGILLGMIAQAVAAVGVVMIKDVLVRSPIVWATEIRLIGGTIGLVIVFLILPRRKQIFRSLINTKKGWAYTISASFLGAYLAMLIWLAGMKYAKVSIASALNQTSTVFVMLFAAFILKEKITLQKVGAIILAVAGAFLVFLG
jgi:drug/metabolite transporter (DMT)-like permease